MAWKWYHKAFLVITIVAAIFKIYSISQQAYLVKECQRGRRLMDGNIPYNCVQILKDLLVDAQRNLVAAHYNLIFYKGNANQCLNSQMHDFASAHECISTLEALERALSWEVNALGKVAWAAAFWENSEYANNALLEFNRANAVLHGAILEYVTKPKASVHEKIARLHVSAADMAFKKKRAILESAKDKATKASGYCNTEQANKYIVLLTEIEEAVEEYIDAAEHEDIEYGNWYQVTEGSYGAGNDYVKQVKEKMVAFREFFDLESAKMDRLIIDINKKKTKASLPSPAARRFRI